MTKFYRSAINSYSVENRRDEYGALKSDGGVDTGEIDAACADEIIQFALFDEIIFG